MLRDETLKDFKEKLDKENGVLTNLRGLDITDLPSETRKRFRLNIAASEMRIERLKRSIRRIGGTGDEYV